MDAKTIKWRITGNFIIRLTLSEHTGSVLQQVKIRKTDIMYFLLWCSEEVHNITHEILLPKKIEPECNQASSSNRKSGL